MDPILGPRYAHAALGDPSTHIRLLRVETSQNGLRIRLSHWRIDQAPQYTAISYQWGSGHTCVVHVNDRPFEVRENCLQALEQVYRHYPNSCIWIDSICIKQSDIYEKSKQVSRMWDIYQNASVVCSCIGPSDDSSTDFFSSIAAADLAFFQDYEAWLWTHGISSSPFPDRDMAWLVHSLRCLSSRSYWARLWIVPEMAAAAMKAKQSFRVLCGSDNIMWSSLEALFKHLPVDEFSSTGLSDQPLWILQWLIREKLNVWSLFISFSDFRCEVPHDRFYALMPLLKESREIPPPPYLRPDYSICSLELALNLAHYVADLHLQAMLEAFACNLDSEALQPPWEFPELPEDSIDGSVTYTLSRDVMHRTRLSIPLEKPDDGYRSGLTFCLRGWIINGLDSDRASYDDSDDDGLDRSPVMLRTDEAKFVVPFALLENTWQRLLQDDTFDKSKLYAIMIGQVNLDSLLIEKPTDCLGKPSSRMILSFRTSSTSSMDFQLEAIGIALGEAPSGYRAARIAEREVIGKDFTMPGLELDGDHAMSVLFRTKRSPGLRVQRLRVRYIERDGIAAHAATPWHCWCETFRDLNQYAQQSLTGRS